MGGRCTLSYAEHEAEDNLRIKINMSNLDSFFYVLTRREYSTCIIYYMLCIRMVGGGGQPLTQSQ